MSDTANYNSVKENEKFLDTDLKKGLSSKEAALRSKQFGFNEMEQMEAESIWLILFRQMNSLIVWILAAAAIVSFFLGDNLEGFAVIAVILINAIVGFVLEYNSRQSMEALRKLDIHLARVLRDEKIEEIPSQQVTIGDILILEAGDLIPADALLLEVNQLTIDESALTGESIPSEKNTEPSDENAPLGDRHNRVFKGTAITNGNATAIVTTVGQLTELGKIATLVHSAKRATTPLDAKLQVLAKVLIWVTLGLGLLFLIVGFLRGQDTKQLIGTAVALAIAAIPEGMAVVATVTLASGMLRLSRKNVIVKQLSAVETLGGTNIIFTDKTGTLTQNKIEVHSLRADGNDLKIRVSSGSKGKQIIEVINGDKHLIKTSEFEILARIGALVNNAQLDSQKSERKEIGDPVEVALLLYARAVGIDLQKLHSDCKRQAELAFSSETRIMATLDQIGTDYFIGVKGAVEEVAALCNWKNREDRDKELEISERMAADGLRTLAFAYRESAQKPDEDFVNEEKLIYAGLIGFLDPPRKEVIKSLNSCHRAGIKVIMVTGDHPATSLKIAKEVKLVKSDEEMVLTGKDLESMDFSAIRDQKRLMECRVFARVNPTQKLDMIDFYQKQGNIVGMTGDGVNDAPALKKSDIGIAMGLRGTAVACEAADMILKDDSFTSIVHAIEQGRVIFENVRKFIVFLLSCNLSEIFVVTFAAFLSFGSPLLPLQILFINIITDVFPALALGVGKENKNLMKLAPRDPKQPILEISDWKRIVFYALVMSVSILGVYWYAINKLNFSPEKANTITFYALSFAQLLHLFNMYSGKFHFFKNEITKNKYIWMALVLCLLIMLMTYYVPFFRQILSIQILDLEALELIFAAGIIPVMVIQTMRIMVPIK